MKEIELTKGYVAFVDNEDFERLNAHLWHVLDGHPWIRYAARWAPGTKPRKAIRMHHVILDIDLAAIMKDNLVVDHKDRNGLNNQRANLHVVTRTINAVNSDRCDNATGIYFDTYRGKYKAVHLPGRKFIGWFDTKEEAYAAKGLSCE